MKFESKFGLGEIVSRDRYKGDELIASEFYEVVSIIITSYGVSYGCRHTSGQVMGFGESELDGDPDFDQEKGAYPTDKLPKS